jgi:hypothetical protein
MVMRLLLRRPGQQARVGSGTSRFRPESFLELAVSRLRFAGI